MILSSQVIATLSDLIENRLAMMTINDQDDLREKLTLQRALTELHAGETVPAELLTGYADIPRRGRRRKISTMAET